MRNLTEKTEEKTEKLIEQAAIRLAHHTMYNALAFDVDDYNYNEDYDYEKKYSRDCEAQASELQLLAINYYNNYLNTIDNINQQIEGRMSEDFEPCFDRDEDKEIIFDNEHEIINDAVFHFHDFLDEYRLDRDKLIKKINSYFGA